MNLNKARIGLALSGGGIRAACYHLGVLQYFAEAGLFNQITSISSVSGGSLCVGAIFAANHNKWPAADKFIEVVRPKVRGLILNSDIQTSALRRIPFSFWFWNNKVGLIAKMLEKKWGIKGSLQDLPKQPYWEINSTIFETGNGFRCRRDFMGDYTIGYVQQPDLPISHMIAASASFPILIGPYILKTKGMNWTKDKMGDEGPIIVDSKYTLWDGGVYDNLGLEALYKIGRGLDEEIDFLVISNASASIAHKKRRVGLSLRNMARLLGIAMSQVDDLRTRDVMAYVMSEGKGIYLKIGSSAGKIAEDFKIPPEKAKPMIENCLSEKDITKARDYATTLKTPSPENFDLIFRHGYENAKCVYLCETYSRNKFSEHLFA